jgi:hypothetical protein
MKTFKLTLSAILLFTIANVFSQSNSVYIIIDEIADNITELKSEFGNQANVYVTDGISPSAIRQISNSMEGLQINDLHIYALTKPGAIVFNSIAVTSSNIEEWSTEMKAWSKNVSSKVVIHSDIVFEGVEGSLLKQHLEETTGLIFAAQN